MSVPGSPRRELLTTALPAAAVGVGAAVMLYVISAVAKVLTDLVWSDLADALGAEPDEPWWIFLVLTAAGVLAGLVIAFVPGHGGPDPATEGLVDRPVGIGVLPGLLLALMITLVGGVSLGPENPVMAVNAALCVAIGARWLPGVAAPTWVALAAAGTIGALFGTPVAAALMLTETTSPDTTRSLWDRLFAPLVAAGFGAGTISLLTDENLALDVGDYPGFAAGDVVAAGAVATGTAALGLVIIWLFPLAHGLLRRVARPPVVAVIGGTVLGLLGAIGGSETLFKGSEEMQDLAVRVDDYSVGALVLIVVIKSLALLVASSSGFAGGRIFPAVFIGAVTGLAVHGAVPSLSLPLTVASATLGVLVAITRSGWLSIFTALVVVPDIDLLPVLVMAVLPAWLLVTGRPTMTIAAVLPPPVKRRGRSGRRHRPSEK